MLELINRYAHGFVVVPVTLACREKGFFELLKQKKALYAEEIVKHLKANAGHLNVVLRMFLSLNWLVKDKDNKYSLAENVSSYQEIPKDSNDLLGLDMTACLIKGDNAKLLRKGIDDSSRRWDISDPLLIDFLDGVLLIPLLIAIKKNNLFDESGALGHEALFSKFHFAVQEDIIRLFENKQWIVREKDNILLTKTGRHIIDRTLITGVTASYRPMLLRMPELLFKDTRQIFSRDTSGDERHIDRELNVLGSGFQHGRYFNDMMGIIRIIFNRQPYEEQPKYIADMGCGDGTLLKKIYDTIRFETGRGAELKAYPLTLIGMDYNAQALKITEQTLVHLPHILIQADVCNPEQMLKDLRENGISDTENILHIRSFLDHNRPYMSFPDSSRPHDSQRSSYEGVYVDKYGQAISSMNMTMDLIEHLRRWADIISKHGLILLEAHCLNPDMVYRFLDKCENLHFDAYHAFSMQYLVEADAFLMCAAAAGLFPKSEFFNKYPKTLIFSRITLNCFEKRSYIIRHPYPDDLQTLIYLETQCWPEPLRTSPDDIIKRIEKYPEGQYVVEMDGRITGVIYSIRISETSILNGITTDQIENRHNSNGKIVFLLALNISPLVRHTGLGDQLLEFMLQQAMVKGCVEMVAGVTRCREYVNHPDSSLEEYIQKKDDNGHLVDPILKFHELHGAFIVGLIPNYRPKDSDNEGNGVLIEYNLYNRRCVDSDKAVAKVDSSEFENMKSKKAITVEKCIRSVLGDKRISKFSKESAFLAMGMDSLDMIELTALLNREFAANLNSTFFFQYSTPEKVIAYFLDGDFVQPREIPDGTL